MARGKVAASGIGMDGEDLVETAWRFVGGDAYQAYVSHPAYGDCARRTLANWALKVREYARIERSLRDLTHWLAAEGAVTLAAEPAGLTADTLERVLLELNVASRGRGGLLLAYLQYLKLIEPLPDGGGKGRHRRHGPTAELTGFMKLRYQRDLEAMAPLDPAAREVLARWETPGLFDRLMAAGRPLAVCSARYRAPREASLELIAERNFGLTILGQILLTDDDGGAFPRRGLVRLNLVDIARRSGAERYQVIRILKLGRKHRLILDQDDGAVVFAPGLIERMERVLGMYWRGLAWRSRQALDWT